MLEVGALLGFLALFALLADQRGDEDAEVVEDGQRRRHRQLPDDEVARRQDRAGDGEEHDGVTVEAPQRLGRDDAEDGEHREEQRQLEDDAEDEQQHRRQAEVLLHRDHRLDVERL